MKRSSFVRCAGSTAAALVASDPLGALAGPLFARGLTQVDLANLAVPRSGQWVRLILGSGVPYQKQIGAAVEQVETGRLLYYETQVGTPGGSCNPNTLKRTYLRGSAFGSLFALAPVLANVANSGTELTRWSDAGGGQTQAPHDRTLRLLDSGYLYDDRPISVVSSRRVRLTVPAGAPYSGPGEIEGGRLRVSTTTHTVATFAKSADDVHQLLSVELWTTPDIPFGIARYRATTKDLGTFEMRVFAYGTHFKTALPMSLQTVRQLTPDGSYVQTN